MICPYCGNEKHAQDRCNKCGLNHADATEQFKRKQENKDMKPAKAPVEEIKKQLVGKAKVQSYGGDPAKGPTAKK